MQGLIYSFDRRHQCEGNVVKMWVRLMFEFNLNITEAVSAISVPSDNEFVIIR